MSSSIVSRILKYHGHAWLPEVEGRNSFHERVQGPLLIPARSVLKTRYENTLPCTVLLAARNLLVRTISRLSITTFSYRLYVPSEHRKTELLPPIVRILRAPV